MDQDVKKKGLHINGRVQRMPTELKMDRISVWEQHPVKSCIEIEDLMISTVQLASYINGRKLVVSNGQLQSITSSKDYHQVP